VKAAKSFCPQDSGVSGKIVGACEKNFLRNPKRFFWAEMGFILLQTENELQVSWNSYGVMLLRE